MPISGLCMETPPPPAVGASKVGHFLQGQWELFILGTKNILSSSHWGWPIGPTFWIIWLWPNKTYIKWCFLKGHILRWKTHKMICQPKLNFKMLHLIFLFVSCLQQWVGPLWPSLWELGLKLFFRIKNYYLS